MNRLYKYIDFLSEQSLQSLLEAKIIFTKDFRDVLDEMDTVTADKLINLEGNDIDINTNYIDVSYEKDGYVYFKPDDKVSKKPFIYKKTEGKCYPDISESINKSEKYFLGKINNPKDEQEVELVKKFKKYELIDMIPYFIDVIKWLYDDGKTELCHIRWIDDGIEYNMVCNDLAIKRDLSDIRTSDVKVGKFVNAIFKKSEINITNKELEDFVNKFKHIVDKRNNKFSKFKIVTGEDIRKYYLFSNYFSEKGQLGKSCMRYERCQKYLDIYVKNSVVSLVVLMSDLPDKIIGRAILWTDQNGAKLMDRIYTNNDHDENLFKEFAIMNGFYYKKDIHSDIFIGPNENIKSTFIKLDRSGEYDFYPYMDSFCYYNVSNGTLGFTYNFNYDYELRDTEGGNGTCDTCGGSGEVECSRCDGDGVSDCSECDGNGELDCRYCDGSGDKDCSECDGNGELDCKSCQGGGKDENDEECTDCSGSGIMNCEYCDSKGKVKCSECDSGTVDCYMCDGSGTGDCGRCDGTGIRNCPEC